VTLLLGRYDRQATLRYVAHSHPLTAGHRGELAPALRTPVFQGAGHPWPCPLPAGWTGDLADRRPLPYRPVEPDLIGAAHGVSPQQAVLAWELSLGDHVIPIPGARRPQSIIDSVAATRLTLAGEEIARCSAAVGLPQTTF
jgi:hypothetical protein